MPERRRENSGPPERIRKKAGLSKPRLFYLSERPGRQGTLLRSLR